MVSSKSFIISGLIFRCLMHFEFIFVYGVRKCSNFILEFSGFKHIYRVLQPLPLDNCS